MISVLVQLSIDSEILPIGVCHIRGYKRHGYGISIVE
jgi:hypothetical protein